MDRSPRVPYAAGTQVPIASATKRLSTTAIARLVDRGAMQWTDTIGMYLPDAPVATRGITLAQLLSQGRINVGCPISAPSIVQPVPGARQSCASAAPMST